MDVPAVANALGTVGAVCWSVQLLPQIVINYRRHHTTGLQPSMMLLWASAGVPLGVYNIVQEFNVALRVQAQILTFLSLITWAQCCHYGKHWHVSKCVGVVALFGIAMGGVEAALIVGIRAAGARHTIWPSKVMAVSAAILLAAGVLRHYWDIYTHRTVRGISFIFVGIDAAGDLFSLVSIFFQAKLDVLGMAMYGSELALWIGVFVCGGYYNLAPWVRASISRTRQQKEDERQQRDQYGEVGAIALHHLPSSTSVFRTPSSAVVERHVPRERSSSTQS
ncbi:MAG: hypothetical protein Q9163_000494 [Psora crenata]